VRPWPVIAAGSVKKDNDNDPFDASDWVQYQGHPAVNNSSRVTWKVKLKPGEAFTPTVLYHYYTRH